VAFKWRNAVWLYFKQRKDKSSIRQEYKKVSRVLILGKKIKIMTAGRNVRG
jgi:hypothetical protein